MTKLTKHTPTPWTAWNAPDGSWVVRAVYEDSQGRRTTAFPAVCHSGGQDNEANAAFIVHAVNSHDALVAIARRAREIAGDDFRKVIDAALKAEEGR